MGNKKQTAKERIYWEEYHKFLSMIDSEVLMQFIRLKDSESSWLREIDNGK